MDYVEKQQSLLDQLRIKLTRIRKKFDKIK